MRWLWNAIECYDCIKKELKCFFSALFIRSFFLQYYHNCSTNETIFSSFCFYIRGAHCECECVSVFGWCLPSPQIRVSWFAKVNYYFGRAFLIFTYLFAFGRSLTAILFLYSCLNFFLYINEKMVVHCLASHSLSNWQLYKRC